LHKREEKKQTNKNECVFQPLFPVALLYSYALHSIHIRTS
jgi:hypothetical protein